MRKPALCICENKDADQLRGNREADQYGVRNGSKATVPFERYFFYRSNLAFFTVRTVKISVRTVPLRLTHLVHHRSAPLFSLHR